MSYFPDDESLLNALNLAHPAVQPGLGVPTGVVDNAVGAVPDSGADLVQSDPRVPGVQALVPASSPYAKGVYQPDPWDQSAPATPGAPGNPNQIGQGVQAGLQTLGQVAGDGLAAQPNNAPQRPRDPLKAAQFDQDRAAENVANETVQTNLAGLEAQNEKAQRGADVLTQFAGKQAELDRAYQAQRLEARQRADQENGRWLQQMEQLAKTEPDHTRYWKNQDGFGKALWLLGMAFSSAALIGQKNAGQTRNPVMEMLQQTMQEDVNDQKESLQRKMTIAKTRGDIMQRNQDIRIADLKDDHSLYFQRLEGLKQAALLRSNAPGPADVKMAYQMGAQKLAEMQQGIATNRANEAFHANESALQRNFTAGQNQLNRALQLMLAQEKIDAAIAKGTAKADKDALKGYTGVTPQTGIVVTSKTGKPVDVSGNGQAEPGSLYVKDGDDAKIVRGLSTQANLNYAAMVRVRDALKDGSFKVLALRQDPQLEADLVQLAYGQTKTNEPGGRITDKDLEVNMTQAVGANLVDLKGRIAAGTFGAGEKALEKFMENHIKDYSSVVENNLKGYLPTELPGYKGGDYKIHWTPQATTAPEVVPQTPAVKTARYGGTLYGEQGAPTGPTTLPGGDKTDSTLISQVHADSVGASPDVLRTMAEDALKAVKGNDGATQAITKDLEDAYARAETVTKNLVMSGFKEPKDMIQQAKEQGITLTGGEARQMSQASARADTALNWWQEQSSQHLLAHPQLSGTNRVYKPPGVDEVDYMHTNKAN